MLLAPSLNGEVDANKDAELVDVVPATPFKYGVNTEPFRTSAT